MSDRFTNGSMPVTKIFLRYLLSENCTVGFCQHFRLTSQPGEIKHFEKLRFYKKYILLTKFFCLVVSLCIDLPISHPVNASYFLYLRKINSQCRYYRKRGAGGIINLIRRMKLGANTVNIIPL